MLARLAIANVPQNAALLILRVALIAPLRVIFTTARRFCHVTCSKSQRLKTDAVRWSVPTGELFSPSHGPGLVVGERYSDGLPMHRRDSSRRQDHQYSMSTG